MSSTKWKTYEEVATCLLRKFKMHFGLENVEGKQKVKGLKTGTDWEIDAKGLKAGPAEMIIVVEIRRHTASGQKQEQLAGLAYRVSDTGAAGGIIVSPLPLQEGAKKVANAAGIVEVTLNKDSTTVDYIMHFLNRIMVGVSDTLILRESVRVVVIDVNGKVKSDNTYE